jgi:hypothetical protein
MNNSYKSPLYCSYVYALGIFAALLIGVISTGTLSALDRLPVQAGAYPISGTVGEIRLLPEPGGSVFVLSTVNGELLMLKYEAGDSPASGSLFPYRSLGLPKGLTAVRALELSGRGPVRYAAFIGSEGGHGEMIYLLEFDDAGELICTPIKETKTEGGITQYTLVCSPDGGSVLYVLSGGSLYCVSSVGVDLWKREYLGEGSPESPIEQFEILLDLKRQFTYGWYSRTRGGGKEFVLFSLGNDVLFKENLGLRQGGAGITQSMTLEGDVLQILIAGEQVEVYRGRGNSFIRDANFNTPAPALGYYPLSSKSEMISVLLCGREVYGVSRRFGVPEFEKWFNSEGNPSFNYSGDNKLSVLYKEAGLWRTALVHLERGLIRDKALELRESQRVFLTPGKLFAQQGSDLPKFDVYGPEGIIGSFEIPREGWEKFGDELFDMDAAQNEKLAQEFIFLPPEIVPLRTVEALVFLDIQTGENRYIPHKMYRAGPSLNGRAYFVCFTGDDIVLYRLEDQ